MTLAACGGETRQGNRTGMTGMALCTGPNRSIVIGLADGVALLATRSRGRVSLRKHQRIRRPLCAAWLKLLTERNLLRTQTLLSVDGGPAGSRVTAAKEFLIDAFMAGTAIAGGQMSADRESMMIDLLLIGCRLMAVKAIDTLASVSGHLVFMYDGVLEPCVTFGTFSRGSDEVGGRLSRLDGGTRPIHKEAAQNEGKRDDNRQEHGTK